MGRYETVCHTGTSNGWDWNCYYFLAGTGMVIISIPAPLFFPNSSPGKTCSHGERYSLWRVQMNCRKQLTEWIKDFISLVPIQDLWTGYENGQDSSG